jgi:hypothetical protein
MSPAAGGGPLEWLKLAAGGQQRAADFRPDSKLAVAHQYTPSFEPGREHRPLVVSRIEVNESTVDVNELLIEVNEARI